MIVLFATVMALVMAVALLTDLLSAVIHRTGEVVDSFGVLDPSHIPVYREQVTFVDVVLVPELLLDLADEL